MKGKSPGWKPSSSTLRGAKRGEATERNSWEESRKRLTGQGRGGGGGGQKKKQCCYGMSQEKTTTKKEKSYFWGKICVEEGGEKNEQRGEGEFTSSKSTL